MSYIVKNCPCFVSGVAIKGNDKKVQTCNNYKIRELTHCSDITDCVIKQVIEKCKYIIDDDICLECNKFERGLDCFECDYDGHREDIMRGISRVSLAKQILQLFDIEEINK